MASTYRRHGHGAPEPSPDTVINALGLAPAGGDTFESVTLVSVEARRACPEDDSLAGRLFLEAKHQEALVPRPHLPWRPQTWQTGKSGRALVAGKLQHRYRIHRHLDNPTRSRQKKTDSEAEARADRGTVGKGEGALVRTENIRFFTMGTCFWAATI